MSMINWVKGKIGSEVAFLANVEKELAVDFAPVVAKVRAEFVTALGDMETAVYAAIKEEVKTVVGKYAAQFAGDPVGLIMAVFADAKAALPGLGATIGDLALHSLVTAIVTAATVVV